MATDLPAQLKSGVATLGAQIGKVHRSFNPVGYWITIGARITLIAICIFVAAFRGWSLLGGKIGA